MHGEIDWPRRFDHMQQHTGQHVLSAAFDRLFGVRTVSFHLGAAVSTIDLAREMTPAEIAAAEAEANRIVWEDRPVAIRFADAEEAARLPLRKEPARGGTLRLIDVEDFDLSACGGTHVARTGAHRRRSPSRRGSGSRADSGSSSCAAAARSSGYRALRDAMAASVRLLSVLPEELPAAIERLQAEAKEQKRSMAALQSELARYRADELAAGAEAVSRPTCTARRPRDRRRRERAEDARAAIAAKPGYLVVLVSSSAPALVVIARSADVDDLSAAAPGATHDRVRRARRRAAGDGAGRRAGGVAGRDPRRRPIGALKFIAAFSTPRTRCPRDFASAGTTGRSIGGQTTTRRSRGTWQAGGAPREAAR